METKKKSLIIGASVLASGVIITTPMIVACKKTESKTKNNVNESFKQKISEYREKSKRFAKIIQQDEVANLNKEIEFAENEAKKSNLTEGDVNSCLQRIEAAYTKALHAFDIKNKKDELSKKIQEITKKIEQLRNPNLVVIKEQVNKALTHAQRIVNSNDLSLTDIDNEIKMLVEAFDSNKSLYDESHKEIEKSKQLLIELDKYPLLKNSIEGQKFQNAYDELIELGSKTITNIEEFKLAKNSLNDLAKIVSDKIKAFLLSSESKEKLSKKIQEITKNLNHFINPNLVLIKNQVNMAIKHAQALVDNQSSTNDDVKAEIEALNTIFETNKKLYDDIHLDLDFNKAILKKLVKYPSIKKMQDDHNKIISELEKEGSNISGSIDILKQLWKKLTDHHFEIKKAIKPFIDRTEALKTWVEALKVDVEALYDHSVNPKVLKFPPFDSAITIIRTEINKLGKSLEINAELKQETVDKLEQTVYKLLLDAAKATWTYFENFYNPKNKRLPFNGDFDEKYKNNPEYQGWKKEYLENYNDFLANKDSYIKSSKTYKELNAKIETYIIKAKQITENPELKKLFENFKNIHGIVKELNDLLNAYQLDLSNAEAILPSITSEQFHIDFVKKVEDALAMVKKPDATKEQLETIKNEIEPAYLKYTGEFAKYKEKNQSTIYNTLIKQAKAILDDTEYKKIDADALKAVKRSDLLFKLKDISAQFRTEVEKIIQEENNATITKDNAWYSQKVEILNNHLSLIKIEFDDIFKKINLYYDNVLKTYNNAIEPTAEYKSVFEQFNNQIKTIKNAKQTFNNTLKTLLNNNIDKYVTANAKFYNAFYPIYLEFNIFNIFATRIPNALYEFKNNKTAADITLNDLKTEDLDIKLPKTYGKGWAKKNIPSEITIDISNAKLEKNTANNSAKVSKIVLKFKSYTREIETETISGFKN